MVSGLGNYQIRFTGNKNQIKTFTPEQVKAHKEPFKAIMKPFLKDAAKLELAVLKYMDEKMNLKGITLYRMNDDGTTIEIKLNTDKTDTIKNNCPN
ncbi:hypothetical protein LNP04_12990 [Chryseobacterium sp. C-71]|uniref:hypothetical protein n=1 Tax=Chryseobacterium sp. C-71 TaxID=2893882 RepID=UPI001E5822FE|nr:hypothetical protein [Chryseobacterium sp. C-71]UFH30891.1 hypothetical protein LNP04_12990 [Chryseobacterium sp. C-71]